ncbi:MAG: class I SAM-dependent methyltransferase [Thermodesulfobacteriota bacterium]|nr:class I SAM-dependent methyltransferase [Thermodesulfobacteriota bacterium]
MNSKAYWNVRLSRYNNYWRDENYYPILDLFPCDEAFTLLDIGCALGDGCELLHERFPKARITGIDISDVGISKAQAKNSGVQYMVLNILKEEIPYMYDYITIIETLEHFDDPFLIVNKCLTHVRNALVISVPYTPDKPSGPVPGVGEHRYLFNEKTFIDYNQGFLKVTDYIKATQSRCIIYHLKPK